ncbi:MAG: serpin family protein [Gemmatimonadota bacterium]
MQRSIFAMLVTVLVACAEDPSGPPRETPREFTLAESQVADASISFGLKLYREVAAADTSPNLMLSPLSASMALGMTMNGAQGETYEAMRGALSFGTLTEDEVNEAYRGLIAQLLARDAKVTFHLANSIWHERALPVKQPFLDAARTYFDAEVTALDFADPTAPKTISGWAERETGGRIKDLVKEIDPREVMFLVNAVYFKAPWTRQFDPRDTRSRPFTRKDGSTVSTPMMTQDANFRFVVNNEVFGLELFYGDSSFSMVLLMPTTGTDLSVIENKLTPAWFDAVVASMRRDRALVTMPKFKLEYGRKLNDELENLGMAIAFDWDRADFYRIADVRPRRLFISRVEQKTFIDVNESGTEAAAATSVGIAIDSAPPQITLDRPFLYAIRERESGAILFIGRVGDPTSK